LNQLRFDENLAIREVLDDIVGMVDRRVRLIEAAGQMVEEMRDERMAGQVKQLERLMSDFLILFDPVLVKVRAYREGLKQSIGESEAFLRSLVGIIDAGKTVDGSSATVQELEKDADEVQTDLDLANRTLDKIENLFSKTRQYIHAEHVPKPVETFKPSSASLSKPGDHYVGARPFVHAQPDARPQQSFQLTNETRDRIRDLANRTLDKIENLFSKTRQYIHAEPVPKPVETFKPSSASLSKSGNHYVGARPFVHAQPDTRPQQSFQLTNETRDRIRDLFTRTGMTEHLNTSPAQQDPSTEELVQPRRMMERSENRPLRPFVRAGLRSSTDQSS